MTKHTQGPWWLSPKDENGSYHICRDPDGFTPLSKGETDICLVCGKKNAKANANLIAAAPDLLAALIELDQHMQASGCEYPEGTFEVVQAAIREATGE